MFRFAIQLPGDWSYPLTRFLSQIEMLQKKMRPKAVTQNVSIRDPAPGRLVIPVNQILITNQNYAAARKLSREKSLLSHYNINECFYK